MNAPKSKPLQIAYYISNDRIYVANANMEYGDKRSNLNFDKYRINGKSIESTHNPKWGCVLNEQDITSVEVFHSESRKKIGYMVIDESVVSDKIPKYLSLTDVNEYCDGEGYLVWDNYSHLRSLYSEAHEVIPSYWEPVEFEKVFYGNIKVDNVENYVDMKVKVYKNDRYPHTDGSREIDLSSVVRWSELEQMLSSDLVLHNRPCSISSKTTYEIIRHYIKDNIDPKVAHVTSDYNFCFTVKKKVAIQPYVYKWEEKKANGKSYRRPRLHTRKVTYNDVKIFEMTNEVDKYRGYTPVKGFEGESLPDLIENVKLYLDELMTDINTPVSQCEHCNGTGHIVHKIGTNER